MRKKTGIFLSVWLCISMILLLLVSTPVHAAETNMVTLNFIGASVDGGKAVVDVVEGCKAKMTLCTKDAWDGYKDCPISGNGMQVDLLENEYYLKVDISLEASSIEDLTSISSSDIRVYINQTSYNINSNSYIKLDPNEFSGNLNIKVEYEPAPPKPGYPDDIQITASYDGVGMEISLNGERIGNESKKIQGTGKGYASGEIYNLIQIQLAFGDGNIGTVTVNGTPINLPEGTKDRVEFALAPASAYKIEVTKGATVKKRIIVWESDNANNTSLKENELLKHGSIAIIGIKDADGTPVELKDINQSASHGYGLIVPGSEITLRVTPEYGYQLDSITINGQSLTPLADTSTYTYTMPDAKVHICGIFTKTEDQTELKTDKVKNASIQLAENEITSGNSRLTIQDAVLTQQQKDAFEKAAGDYRIAGYFDIKLAQILYKNSAANLWVNDIAALKNPAKVSLQLGTDPEVEGNDLIVIHENSDGTYEVLPASFDSVTKTVMFQTKGFSNYAVAYKKSETTTEDSTKETTTESTTEDPSKTTTKDTTEATKDAVTASPKTGDDMNLPVLCVLMLVSGMGCLYARKKR